MIQHLLDTRVGRRRLTFCTDSSVGKICIDKRISMYGIAIAVNDPRSLDIRRLEYFNHM